MFFRTLCTLLLLAAALASFPLHAQWKITNELQRNNPDDFKGIACADSLHCITIGESAYQYPRVKKTTDGGRTWQWLVNPQPDFSGQTAPLRPASAAHPTPELIMVSLNNQRMLRSTDAGASWDTIYFPTVPANWPGGQLKMFDARNGLLVYGAAHFVFATADGGASWTHTEATIPPGQHGYVPMISIFSPLTIYLMSNDPTFPHDSTTLYRTSDGGVSWSSTLLPYFVTYGIADFSDPQHGWAAGDLNIGTGGEVLARDIIARTTDGGESWTKVLDTLIQSAEAPVPWGIFAIDAYDANNVLVVGHRGKILRTRDGGTTWRTENSGIKVTGGPNEWYLAVLKAVRFTSATTAIAVGWNSAIIGYDETSAAVVSRPAGIRPAIVPNPVLSTCTIYPGKGSSRIRRVRVIDVAGAVVISMEERDLREPGDGSSLTIDLSHLSDGVYLIDVDGYAMEKVVKVSR